MQRTLTIAGILLAVAFAGSDTPIADAVSSPQAPVSTPQLSFAVTIPNLMSYQGKLTDTMGIPVPDGNYSTRFRLYTVPSGGTHFWQETQSVSTEDGLFAVLLGSVSPIPYAPEPGNLYLGMKVGADPEMTPRVRIVSAAYSYLARKSDTANYAVAARPTGSAGGDLTGTFPSPTVDGLRDRAVSSSAPSPGQALAWSGSQWTPTTITPSGAAGGDLTGQYPSPVVDGLRGRSVSSAAPATNQVLKWNGNQWAPRNDSVGGGTGNDNDWVRGTPDSVLFTYRRLGIAKGASGNALHGAGRHTHVNLGVVCTTGTPSYSVPSATIGGGEHNVASDTFATVGGGGWNWARDAHTTIGGGLNNRSRDWGATVGGGVQNYADDYCATVGGGIQNRASGPATTVAGGQQNEAGRHYATVGGGRSNRIFGGLVATIAGGAHNRCDGDSAVIGGGGYNYAYGEAAVVAGGTRNTADGDWSTIGGGSGNSADTFCATVSGGHSNTASGRYSSVGGGQVNIANADYSTVAGGYNNVSGDHGFIGGGSSNDIDSAYAVICGGSANEAIGRHSAVGGGWYNRANRYRSTVAGGGDNVAGGVYSLVGGGDGNTASSYGTVVAGGSDNQALGNHSAVGGGSGNSTSNVCSAIAGGEDNTAFMHAAVGGGFQNDAGGQFSAVVGGADNTASAMYSTCGGRACYSSGLYSTAFGRSCSAKSSYAFATGYGSKVPSTRSGSAAFNGQTATASNQLRCGVISKTGGSFTIDHPLDPASKILNHYFVESPDMANIYQGEARLDASGRAVVALPDYFSALNRSPRIQLTGVGTSDIYVAEKVSGNRFTIGGAPGTEVFWMVTGVRKDQSADVIRTLMPVEQPKSGDLAGCMLDDDFLAGTLEQLEQMGESGRFRFRTTAGRRRYETMRNPAAPQ